ncbi:Protein of uncharacterised function (DUF1120) [Buttiauxella agrestis]|uniref:Protein of uncharacterized function (DUF1120) n=2 Tax=Buttiauxella agrestis TaxID=82977 RepID=A0A381KQ73_9ENTR|nr:Protein of uncharacterised function (DUF1120) [Buttiauxella agrestis]
MASSQVQLSFTATAEPPPCHILATPDTLDFGNINRNTLAAKTPTQIPARSFPGGISIQCEAPTSIGFNAVDNSSGSVLNKGSLKWDTPAVTVSPSDTDQRFGLGYTETNTPIGVWNVAFHSAQVDGKQAQVGIVNNGLLDPNDTAPTMRNDGKKVAWVQNNVIAVGEIFSIQADAALTIAPLDELSSSSEIDFAGSATLEIVYL